MLDLQKSVLGEKHPDTIGSMANLAVSYYNQHRYTEAENLEADVLTLRRQILRDGHPSIRLAIQNLSATYKVQGQYNKAKELELQL